jgi:hypothetical protein
MPEEQLPLLKRIRDGANRASHMWRLRVCTIVRKLGEREFSLSIEGNLSPADDLVHALKAGA